MEQLHRRAAQRRLVGEEENSRPARIDPISIHSLTKVRPRAPYLWRAFPCAMKLLP